MANTAAFKPLSAVIKFGTTTIGTGIIEKSGLSFKHEVEDHYGLGDAGQPTLVSGDFKYSAKLSKVWLDHAYFDFADGDSPVTVYFYPNGTASTKLYFTLAGAYITDWDLKMDRGSVVLEDVVFKGSDITSETVS